MSVVLKIWHKEESRPATLQEIESEIFLNPYVDGSGRVSIDVGERGFSYDIERKYQVWVEHSFV